MDKIRVDTELLVECGVLIDTSGKTASTLADDIRSVLVAMPECCKEKYSRVVQSYEREARSISSDLNKLRDGVNKAVELFSECERSIRERAVFEEAPDAQIGKGINAKIDWNTWPWSWIDGVLDWLGIDEQGRDYEQDHIRDQISDLFDSSKYSKKTWEKSTIEEKKKMLNDLQKDLNTIYGTNITAEINFFSEKADSRGAIVLGYYFDGDRQVSINTEILTDGNYKKVMGTMVHEMRHAYQSEVVRNPDQFIVDEETVQAWEDNFNNYISYSAEKNNFAEYQNQPIEKDANDISNNVNYHSWF